MPMANPSSSLIFLQEKVDSHVPVDPNKQINPNLISSVASARTFTMQIGGVTASATQIVSAASASAFTLQVGGVTASATQITSVASASAFTIQPGGVTASATQITSVASASAFTLQVGGITASANFIDSTATAYTPSLTLATSYYTHVLSATNSLGTTSMHMGSVYLEARDYTTIGALINELKYGGGDKTTFVEFKRFSNGSQLTSVKAIGSSNHNSATSSNVTVSNSDWYDIYMSSSGTGVTNTTSSIRGVWFQW